MIFVDKREGSDDVYVSLKAAGLPVDLTHLDSGDLYFVGRGLKGVPVNIGIEHKAIGDLINSFKTERMAEQLQKMRGAEPHEPPAFDFAWLIIEGELLFDQRGMLMRRTSKRSTKPLGMTANELHKRLLTFHICGGLNPVWMRDRAATVRWIDAFYHFWTDQDLDEHKSHLAIYQAPTLIPVSQFRRTIHTLPQVGQSVSREAEKAFKSSIRRAVNASVGEWAALETTGKDGKTKKFGTVHANKLVEALQ